MKMKKEHYDYMKKSLSKFKDKIDEHRKFIIREGRAKDVEKRLRWDLFWGAKLHEFTSSTLYTYLNDTHIDTALKRIIKELEAPE